MFPYKAVFIVASAVVLLAAMVLDPKHGSHGVDAREVLAINSNSVTSQFITLLVESDLRKEATGDDFLTFAATHDSVLYNITMKSTTPFNLINGPGKATTLSISTRKPDVYPNYELEGARFFRDLSGMLFIVVVGLLSIRDVLIWCGYPRVEEAGVWAAWACGYLRYLAFAWIMAPAAAYSVGKRHIVEAARRAQADAEVREHEKTTSGEQAEVPKDHEHGDSKQKYV